MKQKKEIIPESSWYVITVKSNTEDATAKNLKQKIYSYKLSDSIFDIKILKEKRVTIEEINVEDQPTIRKNKNVVWETITNSNGDVIKYRKTKTENKNIFPGYIFINMIMTDQSWYIIRNTLGVTGIVGSSGQNVKPTPISEGEMATLLSTTERLSRDEGLSQEQIDQGITSIDVQEDAIVVEKKEYIANFEVGNTVSFIMDDADEPEEGIVRKIDQSRGIASIEIVFFGRPQEVEVKFEQVLDK